MWVFSLSQVEAEEEEEGISRSLGLDGLECEPFILSCWMFLLNESIKAFSSDLYGQGTS